MLNIVDYQHINTFKDTIHKNLIIDKDAKSFRERVSITLRKVFGYQHVIFGYIPTSTERQITYDIAFHNLDIKFTQKFLMSNFIHEKSFYDKDDVVIFSDIPNYQKRTLYKELLLPNKLSDFMIFYLTAQNAYIGFIIVFNNTQQQAFEKKDREIAASIQEFIGVEYFNYSSLLTLKSNNDLLITQTNYYPIGIIILKNFREATYANETAKDYMSDLELSSLKFFNLFFTKHILPHIKYELRSIGKKHTIRYKNFIFSIVSINPLSQIFFEGLENPQIMSNTQNQFNSAQEIISYIYILKDELSSLNKNKDFFSDFQFTNQEEKIVDLILLGKNNKQISEELNISINTVRVHIQNIYKKAGVTNRTEFLFRLNSL